MTRAVLAGHPDGSWRLYRQPRWMAEVRRDPAASAFPRRHFDLEEPAFRACLEGWGTEKAGESLESALGWISRSGGSEVIGPFGP